MTTLTAKYAEKGERDLVEAVPHLHRAVKRMEEEQKGREQVQVQVWACLGRISRHNMPGNLLGAVSCLGGLDQKKVA